MSNISTILHNSKYINILKIAGEIGKDMNIQTFIVGGYVRDVILGRDLKDIDFMVEDKVFVFSEKLSKKYTANFLSIHPLFGPGASIYNKQKFALIPIKSEIKEKQYFRKI